MYSFIARTVPIADLIGEVFRMSLTENGLHPKISLSSYCGAVVVFVCYPVDFSDSSKKSTSDAIRLPRIGTGSSAMSAATVVPDRAILIGGQLIGFVEW